MEMLAHRGRMAASDIYKEFSSTPQAISQHLRVLREADLVRVEKQGQKRLYAINGDRVQELEEWEKKTDSLILGEQKEMLLLEAANDDNVLDLDAPLPEVTREEVLAAKKKRKDKKENKYKDFME